MEEVFFGQGVGDEYALGDSISAEDRIKSLLSDSDRGIAARRRVVRRPVGSGSGYLAPIVYSEVRTHAHTCLPSAAGARCRATRAPTSLSMCPH